MKINTTVTLDAELFKLAKNNKLKISQLCNDTLRNHFQMQGDIDVQITLIKKIIAELEQDILNKKAYLNACESAKNAQTEQERTEYLAKVREINQAEKAHGKNRWL